MDINSITDKVIGAAVRVHSQLGPGLLESPYQKCLSIELATTGLSFECQSPINVVYNGIKIGPSYYIDILVERRLVVEVKAVDRFHPIHTAQLITYLKLSGCAVGLLLNFHAYNMSAGIKRVVLGYKGNLPRFPRFPR